MKRGGLLLLLALLCGIPLRAEVDAYNVPKVVNSCIAGIQHRDFELSDRMNPFYLRGDFDGDRKEDYAVLIKQISSDKSGILICFGGRRHHVRIGAGTPFVFEGLQFDNLEYFDAWDIEEPDADFPRDRIHLVAKESASGWIYWDGREFKWQQGAI